MPPEDKEVSRYSRRVTDTFIQLKELGDEVHGKLVAVSAQPFGDRTVGRYTVENEGGRFTFLGSDQIDHMLAGKGIGYEFLLRYSGDAVARSGNRVKQFELYEVGS